MMSSTVGRVDRADIWTLAGGLAAAGAAAYLLLHASPAVAFGICALPVSLWLFARPKLGVVLFGASIPIFYDLMGGRAGFHLSPSDILLVLVAANVLAAAVLTGSSAALHALRPLKRPLLQYGVFLLLLLSVHLSLKDVAKTTQRFELLLLPMVIGAFAVLAGREVAVLRAYVLTACGLAVLWPVVPALGQKNPVGQMIGNALLLLIGVRSLRRYAFLALILVPGLFLTGSRGAIVATVVGVAVTLSLQEARGRAVFTRLSLVGLVAFVAFALLPVSLQDRLTTFSGGTGSRAAYAVHVRQQYAADAEQLAAHHPYAGVGVGNYLSGSAVAGTQTTDPHNVLLLEAAEGGYGFAVSFLLLIAGVFGAIRRMARVELAPVALGVFVATFVHGLVDIYWVRGTPLLAWLLVGMACGAFARERASIGVEP